LFFLQKQLLNGSLENADFLFWRLKKHPLYISVSLSETDSMNVVIAEYGKKPLKVCCGRQSCLIFETSWLYMPEDDIVMFFFINYLGFWYSRYTMPIIWVLNTAC
jgi:hypothetical protein